MFKNDVFFNDFYDMLVRSLIMVYDYDWNWIIGWKWKWAGSQEIALNPFIMGTGNPFRYIKKRGQTPLVIYQFSYKNMYQNGTGIRLCSSSKYTLQKTSKVKVLLLQTNILRFAATKKFVVRSFYFSRNNTMVKWNSSYYKLIY